MDTKTMPTTAEFEAACTWAKTHPGHSVIITIRATYSDFVVFSSDTDCAASVRGKKFTAASASKGITRAERAKKYQQRLDQGK